MKYDNFVPFGGPQSGTVSIQLMIELIPKPSRKQSITLIFTTKIACHNALILKINNITNSSLNMSYGGIFVKHTLCSLY